MLSISFLYFFTFDPKQAPRHCRGGSFCASSPTSPRPRLYAFPSSAKVFNTFGLKLPTLRWSFPRGAAKPPTAIAGVRRPPRTSAGPERRDVQRRSPRSCFCRRAAAARAPSAARPPGPRRTAAPRPGAPAAARAGAPSRPGAAARSGCSRPARQSTRRGD